MSMRICKHDAKKDVNVYKTKFRYMIKSVLITCCKHTRVSMFIGRYRKLMSKQRRFIFVFKILILTTLYTYFSFGSKTAKMRKNIKYTVSNIFVISKNEF